MPFAVRCSHPVAAGASPRWASRVREACGSASGSIPPMTDREMPPEKPFRRMQELRKISREYPFICPVDFAPHRGSPPGEDPNDDPTFIERHSRDDGDHYLG